MLNSTQLETQLETWRCIKCKQLISNPKCVHYKLDRLIVEFLVPRDFKELKTLHIVTFLSISKLIDILSYHRKTMLEIGNL